MLNESTVKSILNQTKDRYPEAFKKCHKIGDPAAWDFIILGCRELNKMDSSVGMNGKRGNVNDPSMDAIYNDGRIVDVVERAGSDSANIYYNDVTDAGPGAFVDPFAWKVHGNYSTPHTTLSGGSLFPMVSGYQKYPSVILDFLKEYREMHCDYVRWMFTVGGKLFGGVDPWADIGAFFSDSSHAFWVRETFKILRANKLKSHVVLCGTHEQYVDFGNAIIDRFVECVNGYEADVILLEMANEFDVNDFNTSEIRNMARYARSKLPSGFPITLSSPSTCHDPNSTRDMVASQIDKMYGGDSGANQFTMHNSRPNPVWNPLSIRDILSPSIAVWDSERRGPGASAGGNVTDPMVLGGDYQTAIKGNAKGCVFHSMPGVWIGHCNGFPNENTWKLLSDIPNWPQIKEVHKTIRDGGNVIPIPPTGQHFAKHPYPDENTYWKDYSIEAAEIYRKAGREDIAKLLELDPFIFTHWSRPSWDLADFLTPEESYQKHLNELAAHLGVIRGSSESTSVAQSNETSHYRY